MEVIRNSSHNNRDYIIVDTNLNLEKGETIIATPIHIRVDVSKLSEIDRAIVFGKVNGTFNHVLNIRNRQKNSSKSPWWKKMINI